MRHHPVHALTVLAAALCWLAGCAPTVRVNIVQPAEISLAKFDRIAVAEIEGRHGRDIEEALIQELVQTTRFQVLDRRNLEKLMQEHNLALSGLVDEATAAELGKLIPAAALILGRADVEQNEVEVPADIELEAEDGTTKRVKGKIRRATVHFDAFLQVVDLTRARTLAARKVNHTVEEETKPTQGRPPRIDISPLRWRARDEVVAQFMRLITPTARVEDVEFKDVDASPDTAVALRHLRVDDWDAAIESFREAWRKGSSDAQPPLSDDEKARRAYNLGRALCARVETLEQVENLGEYEEGLGYLQQAWNLGDGAFSSFYEDAYNDAREREAELRKLWGLD